MELLKHFAPEFAENHILKKALNVARYMKQDMVNDTTDNSLKI
ncbi:MAG: hypothetical protein AB7W47_01575 [Calditrichaceae bacterium]